jgi:hypothetical protein
MACAPDRGTLLGMQCPIDPRAQSGLMGELISGGITALVAERIAECKGKPMATATETHTHAAPAPNGAPPSPEPVILDGRIAERCAAGDDLGLMQQLGAIP